MKNLVLTIEQLYDKAISTARETGSEHKLELDKEVFCHPPLQRYIGWIMSERNGHMTILWFVNDIDALA